MVQNLPSMQETQVQSLCREDCLEKEMATHSRTHAWRIPWPEEPGKLQSIGRWVRYNWVTKHELKHIPLLAQFYRKEDETHKRNIIQGFSGSGRAKFWILLNINLKSEHRVKITEFIN